MLVGRFEAVVPTDYHQFLLEPAQSDGIPHEKFPEFNLAVFGGQTVRVNVGTRAGPVSLALELHDSPHSFDDAEWEDDAEGDLYYDNPGGLAIWGLEYGGFEQAIPETPGTTITPPGQQPVQSSDLRTRKGHRLRRPSLGGSSRELPDSNVADGSRGRA